MWRALRPMLGCALVGAAGLILALATLRYVHARHVDDAKRWCEGVAVQVEAWRAAHGRLPVTLDEAGLGTDPPALCRSGLIYKVEPERFVLDFGTGLWVSGWCYDSRTRAWVRYN